MPTDTTYNQILNITLKYGDDVHASASTWTSLGALLSLDIPEEEVEEITVAPINQSYDDKRSGRTSYGDLSFSVPHEDTLFTTLKAMVGVIKGWQITFADASEYEIDGFVKSVKVGESDGINTIEVAIACTGEDSYVGT